MLAQAIVTQGYLWVAILVLALWIAIKTRAAMPAPLDKEAEANPTVVLNIEMMLAKAMGFGLLLVGGIVYALIT